MVKTKKQDMRSPEEIALDVMAGAGLKFRTDADGMDGE